MHYQLKFFPYKQNFKQPLKTSHGIWHIREGIILQLISKTGEIGLGEIAPLSWFGSETLSEALDFCHRLPKKITTETIFSIRSLFFLRKHFSQQKPFLPAETFF